MAESDLIRGNVDTVILKVLYEGDRYGYDMIKQINARSGGQWEIKQPTLYACLKRLEKQGFVASYWDASESNGGRRKYYTLTDAGREVFVSYKNEWERSRDLFGELITGDDPILPVDDFSDVEEDDYEVPKRRTGGKREKKQKKQEPNASVEYTPPPFEGHEYIHSAKEETPVSPSTEPEYNDAVILDEEPTDESTETAQVDETAVYAAREEYVGAPAAEETVTNADGNKNDAAADSENIDYDVPVQTADPHSVIEEIYAATYTGSRSYADARGKTYDERTDDIKVTEPAAAEKPAVAEPPAVPSPAAESNTALQPYEGGAPALERTESLARREYKDILGELVSRAEARNVSEAQNDETAVEEQAAAEAADGRIEIRRFDGVRQSVSELGNEFTVRAHNDSAKQYAHKYYYYSNKLMMAHYTAMCALMFVIGTVMILTFYLGLGMRMKYDYLLYIAAWLLPIVMIIAAVIIFAGDPEKKKRINVNFRFYMIIRCIIMLQVAVIIYCFNLICGMPVGFSAEYSPSLVIPCVYALFIPISEIIFMYLLKSERYAVA